MTEDNQRDTPPSEERVRVALMSFAALVRRLDREGQLLRGIPFLMGRLGDLRQLLFDYEVRATERLLPIEDPAERESKRIVREAREREEEGREDWNKGWEPPA
jgi:hypothetical protein